MQLPPPLYKRLSDTKLASSLNGNGIKHQRIKLWHKIAIGLVLLIGLRHLNTVPHRERSLYIAYNGKGQAFSYNIVTEETLLGSTYRLMAGNEPTRLSSKHFEDLVH
jgi:hypothetical protein